MFTQLFGKFLISTKRISEQQFKEVLETQKKAKVKLGLIAVSEKLMTIQQADEVNRLQAVMDKRFGDIAIEKGYLNNEQVSRLLGMQGNEYLTFVQAITDNGFMDLNGVEDALSEYQKDNAFTATDMDWLKSGEIDKIVPLYLPIMNCTLHKDLIGVAIRTLLRLIDSDLYFEKAYMAESVELDSFAIQNLIGERKASLSIAGDEDALLPVANIFAGETFEEVDLDALDSVGELINCINGLFATATAASAQANMDMEPPMFFDKRSTAKAGAICVLPVWIQGKKIFILSSFDDIIRL